MTGPQLFFDISANGLRPDCWDAMALSAALVFAIAVILAPSLNVRLDAMINALQLHGTLPLSEQLKADLRRSDQPMQVASALVFSGLIFGSYVRFYAQEIPIF